GWIGPEARETAPQVIRALADKNENVRRKAAYTLGRLNAEPAAAIGVLIKAFEDKSGDVRQAAAEALSKYGEKAVPALIEILQGEKEQPRLEAASALAQIGSDAKEAVPALKKLLLGKQANVHPYAEALAKIGKTSLPTFTEALKDDRSAIRQLAVQSLGQ